jgi:hypothetical protein
VIAAVLYLVAAAMAALVLPSHRGNFSEAWRKRAAVTYVAAVLLGSWLLAVLQQSTTASELTHSFVISEAGIGVLGFGVIAVSIWLAYHGRVKKLQLGIWREAMGPVLMAVVAVLAISAVTVWLLWLMCRFLYGILGAHPQTTFLQQHGSDHRLFIVFAVPIVITILMAATSLFCALMGWFEMEEDREWWARMGGAFLIFNLIWISAHGIAFYGQGAGTHLLAGISGLALGMVGSGLGWSGATSAGPRPVKAAQLTSVGKFLDKHKLILPVIGGISLFLIALGLTSVEETLRTLLQASFGKTYSALILLGLSGFFAVLINYAVNINLFSLHGMYRMRLMRAFLGASNVFRHPDPFTNFDPKDTPYVTDLPVCEGVPLHVVNATLNLTGTKNTAWKQRRAESFTFTPVQCGGWRVGYVKTACYGGTRGLTLATAMSISGAAFNPNMGYQSSPVLSLLMTFFNVRLGVWLPNPRRPRPKIPWGAKDEKFFRKSGPTCALQPLVEEALGNTDDDYRWIELSDGGHFENLGLYEMVMRRCRNIIVVDAGADPTCQFEDLGNAIRKIQIDFGIPIVFPANMGMSAGMKRKNSYCVAASIQYHCVDAVPAGLNNCEFDGRLIYIKAGLTGQEPADILQYAKTHPTFPHETTGNQFFTESQFESYRHLGSYVVDKIAAAPSATTAWEGTNTFDAFLKAANSYWQGQTASLQRGAAGC